MSTAKAADEAIDLAKIVYKAVKSPYDRRVPVADVSFNTQYGTSYPTVPFKNPDLYDTPDSVLEAVALGKLNKDFGATLLRDKFNVKNVYSKSTGAEDKFNRMLQNYINSNPKIQQEYEDLVYHANILGRTDGNPKNFQPLKGQKMQMSLIRASYVNRAIDKAMDPNYLKEYGDLPFRFKYMNALKDIVDPKAPINSMSGTTFENYLNAGERLAKARNLNLNFRPPKSVPDLSAGITGAGYQIEKFATINDGRTLLPMSMFLAREATKAKKRSMSSQQFLNNFNIGDRLDTGSFEYVTPLRMSIPGQEGKSFYQIKYNLMNRTPGNKQRLDQINRLFEGNKPVVTLDHIQPQRFGGTNDEFNLRYIFESGHFGGARQTALESDDLTMFVGSKGQTAIRPTVTDKTNLENDVYDRTMKIVDLVKNNKIDEAQKLSDEVFFLVENFKKVNPSVDFKLGIPYVPVKSGNKTITYIPYHQHLKLNKEQTEQLFLTRGEGGNALLQQYENLPNAGDTIQKSFDKAYDRLAPFIMEGKKLTEADRKGLFEMKAKGGAVGLNQGGDGFFERVKKQFFEGQQYPYEVASDQPIENKLKDVTPEQVIKVSDDIRLQGIEDFVKEKKNKFNNRYDNENLSPDTRQFIMSSNAYHQHLENKKMAISKAEVCGITPNAPGCSDYFPNGQFFNELTGETKPLGPATMYDVQDFYNQLENTDYFKTMFARAKGDGPFAEAASNAKKEMAANSIKRLPLATADLLLDFYQVLSPMGIAAGEAKTAAEIRKGTDITREEFAEYIKQTNPGVSDEFLEQIVEGALTSFDDGVGYMPGVTGKVEDKFGRTVFVPPGGVEGREPTALEKAKQYGISGLGFLPLVTKPTYTGKIMEVLSRKDIGTFGKVLRATPRVLGIPTKEDAIGILKLLREIAYKNKYAPIKIPFRAGQYATATVKPGTENVFVVGNKTLPELGLSLPANEIAKRQNFQQMIKNTSLLIRQLEDQKVQEQVKADEKAYQEFKLTTLKPDFEYNDQLKHFYQNSIREMVADPEALPFPDTDDIEYLSNLPFDPNETPYNVIRYAKELANSYIEQNNLKRNTIGDMLFYDMKNKEEEPVDIFEEDVETNVVPRLAMGGDPGQFTDPLRTPDDSDIDIQSIQQGSPYLGIDELDMFFEDANLKPTNRDQALPPEVQMANVVFGKAPGYAIAGANKVDDLLRGGNTGKRIEQADYLSDQAGNILGEKANRFFSGLEARLIDPNAPKAFARPEDLYNFLQSKGISKAEVEDYQIPQLIETMAKTGQPITKAALLDRIKNAPIRKLKSYTRGFRSEVENPDGQFVDGKYARDYYEKGSIPDSYRENILYLNADDIPGDVGVYKYSTHGFFPDDTTNYVIGWTRSTDRYAIIPGTQAQLTNVGAKTDELNKKIERLSKIVNRSPQDIVNQSGGRVSLEQATTNINRAKKQLTQAQDELANVGKTDDAVVTGDQTVRVTFADEIQSDIMQTYRKHLENVMADYQKLIDKGIDVKDTAKIRAEGYRMDLRTDNDILQFYAKHKNLMRPVFKTEEDFAAYVNDLRKSQAVFKDFSKIKPGQMPPGALAAVQAAGKERDKVLAMFEEAFTNPETLKKLFPNIPFKDRKVWGDALIKNDLAVAAKRKFVDKDPNAADWYVISPGELVANRYGQTGTTATPFAQRTKNMKGIGQYEFYGGPNVTDPDGKHFTSILEQSLRRAANVNNSEIKIVKVQIGEAKSVSRSVQVVNAQGDVIKEFKIPKKLSGETVFADYMNKAQDYISAAEDGQGLIVRPIETPSGFKTIDAYAIKLTPEMVLPTKTHLASGGYVRYDPLVSIDEMIGAA